MLSYRHAFHVGNHADVLKHATLIHALQYLIRKDKPLMYVDTHAGAALYDLHHAWARKTGEAQTGIQKLWGQQTGHALIDDYLSLVKSFNPEGALRHYPGSPEIARQVLRPIDRIRLFELHPTEAVALQGSQEGLGPVQVQEGDGFELLRSAVPPVSRRGAILIDPSYEDKADYRRVVACVRDALKRFATGTYLIWYPLVQKVEATEFARRLPNLTEGDWLHATLAVSEPPDNGLGLYGSGMFIINPPYTMPDALKKALPFLAETLGQDQGAGYSLDWQIK